MIKDYVITYVINYEKKMYDGRYMTSTEHKITIPALTLFDAVDYAHNTLELKDIKEVWLA